MDKFSVYGNLVATPGHGEELLTYLLEAAEGMKAIDNCDCYIVGTNPDQPEAVYVFEVWENEAAHKASLQLPVFRELIDKAKPIIAGMNDYPNLVIKGGKGVKNTD